MSEQCFCLRWNNYHSSVLGDLKLLLEKEEFVDVTISCDGRRLKAHRLMLSACSSYFEGLLKDNPCDHPVIVLKDVRFWEIESIMDFIYNGQVNIMQEQLPGFIRTAEALQIKGLAAVNRTNNQLQEAYLREFYWKDQYKPRSNDKRQHLSTDQVSKFPRVNNGFPTKFPYTSKCTENGSTESHEILPLKLSSKRDILKETPSEISSDPLVSDGKNDVDGTNFNSMKTEKKGSEDSNDQLQIHSRSESPDDSEKNSHDDPMTQIDRLKDMDWNMMNSDQSNALSISLNEAGLPICKICGKVFKHQGSLVAHYQVHQQRTKCPVCKKVLSRHYHMKVHLLTVHKVPDSQIEGLLRSQNIT